MLLGKIDTDLCNIWKQSLVVLTVSNIFRSNLNNKWVKFFDRINKPCSDDADKE